MSFPTQPAFTVFTKGWAPNLLVHPATKFLHEHEKVWDAKDYEASAAYYNLDVFTYVKSTGQVFATGGLEQLQQDYGLFAAYYHEPIFGIVVEHADGNGWRVFGQAALFVDLPGPGGEKKHTDLSGREWELRSEGAFIFDIEKADGAPHGLRFTYQQTFADPTPFLGEAIKRGVIPIETLTA